MTYLLSPTLSLSTLSPSNVILSPYSPSYMTKTNPPTFITPLGPTIIRQPMNIDSGVDNYVVQKDITKGIMYKILDKWLYTEFSSVLKYLKVENDRVKIVKSKKEAEDNRISSDSSNDLIKKSDYIHENILTEHKTRQILMRIIRELDVKWYELPYREGILIDVFGKYLKKKLKKSM
jgi:hypothetical protein